MVYPGVYTLVYIPRWCIAQYTQVVYIAQYTQVVYIPGCTSHGGYPRVYLSWWVSLGCTVGGVWPGVYLSGVYLSGVYLSVCTTFRHF